MPESLLRRGAKGRDGEGVARGARLSLRGRPSIKAVLSTRLEVTSSLERLRGEEEKPYCSRETKWFKSLLLQSGRNSTGEEQGEEGRRERRKGEEKRKRSCGIFKVESLVTTGMSGEEAEREPWHEDRQDLCTASAILLSGESETNGEHDLFQVPIIRSLGKAPQSSYLPPPLSSVSAVYRLTKCHCLEKITNITMFQSRRKKDIFNQVTVNQRSSLLLNFLWPPTWFLLKIATISICIYKIV